MISRCLAVVCLSALAPIAQADIAVRFVEGAPKDRFVLTNTGTCPITNAAIELDLATAPAGLIFDTTNAGAGVEVFQPFELIEGAGALNAAPEVVDGDRAIAFDVAMLDPGARIAFTIDVDDTTSTRQITVSGSEIAGAQVVLAVSGQESARAAFSDAAEAVVKTQACMS